MDYIEFEHQWGYQGVFGINEIRLVTPHFNTDNLTRWRERGYIVRLKNGWYAFNSALQRPEIARLISNKIYYPSYVSLETALCAYDIIPESVVDITAVSPKKTQRFENEAGRFCYYSIKPELMFGYKPVRMLNGLYYTMALPEKAILDFLYLHPEYKTEQDMNDLRFDEVFMEEILNRERLAEYLERFHSQALSDRINTLLKSYNV